jgi:putative restriction endonuclease
MAKSASVFGPVLGFAPGHEFANRLELWSAGVHRQTQAGISARHLGAVIIYTGRGGRSAESQQQVADQTLTGANRELARNVLTGLPVRVTRKVTEAGRSFYRYAGLYRIASYWAETGKSGHRVWRFRLEELADWTAALEPAAPAPDLFTAHEPTPAYSPAPRRLATTLRLVRDTAVTRQVKLLHNYHCQVCGERLASPAGPYAEAAHIRPLGAPHHGPDTLANVLCLCPNHHVLFDLGSFGVADNGALLGLAGQLRQHSRHVVAPEHLAYHRTHFYEPQASELP